MSIPVDLAALGEALLRHDTAYLLTGGGGRPHVAEVFPELVDGVLVIPQPGRTASGAVGREPLVTLMLPPRERGGHTLIVDGDADLADGGALRLTPTHAVLHRAAGHAEREGQPNAGQEAEHEAPQSACGQDCRPIGTQQ